ncbi:CHAT domain-containing protein [Frankia gtarii]|uniref:CHAT domain-containing protein n=1 Tax=Frankia gtarii TaxID=2950102 RepID=UPI0021BFA83E|nr:CHAT domain-containing protein [Frankia gtarii]
MLDEVLIMCAAREDLDLAWSGTLIGREPAGRRSDHVAEMMLRQLADGEPGHAADLATATDLSPIPAALSEPDASAAALALTKSPARAAAWVLTVRMGRLWFPGNLSGEDLAALPLLGAERVQSVVAAAGGDRADRLLVRLAAEVGMLRSSVVGARRTGPQRGQAAARRYVEYLQAQRTVALDLGLRRTADRMALVAADLLRLGGLHDDARRVVTELADRLRGSTDRADTLMSAQCHLLIGDGLVTPGSSPEVLGLDLGELGHTPAPVPPEDRADAESSYRTALHLCTEVNAPRGIAAAALRRAYLRRLAGDDAQASALAAAAANQFAAAGDSAGFHLAVLHRVLADVAAGQLSATGPPVAAEIVRWATTVGSPSYAAGLARVARGVGRRWRTAGDVERARVTLTLANDITTGLDDPVESRSALADLADLYVSINSRRPAIVTFELAINRRLPEVGGWDDRAPMPFTVWSELAELVLGQLAMLVEVRDLPGLTRSAGRMRALLARRPHATEPALAYDPAVSGERVLSALIELGARRVTSAGVPATETEFAPRVTAAVSAGLATQLVLLAAMGPLLEAKHLRASGREEAALKRAERGLRAARAAGEAGRAYEIVILAWLGRYVQARARVMDLAAASPELPAARHVELLVAAHGFTEAAAVLAASGGARPDGERGPYADSSFARMAERDRRLLAATVALGADEPARARSLLREAIDEFERWFAGLSHDVHRTSVCDDLKINELYLRAAQAALAVGDAGAALVLGDRPRSLPLRYLLDDRLELRRSPAQQAGAIRCWNEANARWTGAFDELATIRPQDGPAVADARRRLDRAQADLERAEAAARRAAPQLAARARRRTSPSSMDAAAVAEHLPPGALLLSFMAGSDVLLGWALTGRRTVGRTTWIAPDRLLGLARSAVGALAGVPTADPAAPAELAALLLEPFRPLIEEHDQVIVAGGGAFGLVPFAALPFDGGRPLGASRVVSQVPALDLLTRSTADRPISTRDAVVIGPGRFAPTRGLPALPGAALEARLVARALDARLLGSDGPEPATRDRVRAALGTARVLHVASHGLLREDAATNSAVALDGADELSVADLMGLDFDADLVVLSACDTGRGVATFGGEILGLARGLLAAGTRRAVVSLWPVDDVATCVLMVEFYRGLVAGKAPASALGAAREHLRGLSAADRAEHYASLAAAAGVATAAADAVGSSPRSRNLHPEPPSRPTSASDGLAGSRLWAPFVLIGAP